MACTKIVPPEFYFFVNNMFCMLIHFFVHLIYFWSQLLYVTTSAKHKDLKNNRELSPVL